MRNELRQRNSPLLYVLTFLTGGFFALVWVYLMNRDIQRADPSHFPLLRWLALISLVYPFALMGHSYATSEGFSFSGILAIRAAAVVSWLALVWFWFGGIVAVGRYLRHRGAEVPGNVALILLTFVFVLSLPLLQRNLNSMASRVRRGVASTVVPNA